MKDIKDKKLLSFSNIKLGHMASFSLPTAVCGKGAEEQGCKGGHCYAQKMEQFRKQCVIKWGENYEATLQSDFVIRMNQELQKKKPKIVRIHVSGDFYSQAYVDKVFEIARLNPGIQFYTYTKALEFDYSKRPSNLKILVSDDRLIWKDKHDLLDGVATIIFRSYKGNVIPKGFKVCLNQKTHGVTLCEKCKMCLQKGCKVAFIQH